MSFRPHVPPIVQSTSFLYDSADEAEAAARGERYCYSREANPTEDELASRIAALEGAEAALTFSSGMGAMAAALEAFLSAGDHLVALRGLYGGTHALITSLLARFGVAHTLVDDATVAAIEPALRENTRVVFVESISNPLLRIADLDGIGALLRERGRARGIAFLVDATFATPILQRPLQHGATLSLHSATKYLNGHGDATCGVASGTRETVEKLRPLRKYHGASCDPFAAWLVMRGLRTLRLRVERQVATASTLANALVPLVPRVHFPSLPSHPDRALASRLLDGPGAMIAFEAPGGLDGARRVYDRLQTIARAASLGEVTSLMTHPARFSHTQLSPEDRERAGISDGLLRLSVGLEDADVLLNDLKRALG